VLTSNSTARGLLSLYSSTVLSAAWAVVIPTIPVLSVQFGVSVGAGAQIITAFGIGRFVGTAAGGTVIDRMGTRVALVGGSSITAISACLAAATPWLAVLLGLAVVMGVGDSLAASGREVAAIDLASHSQRGRVLSTLHGSHNIGLTLCPLLGGFLTDVWSFRAAFVAYAFAAAVSVFLGFKIPASPVTLNSPLAAKMIGWGARLRGLGSLFRQIEPELRSTYLVLVLATLAAHSQRVMVQSILPLYAGTALRLSPTDIGLLFTISGLFVLIMIVPTGFVMDRVGRKWATVPSTGIPAIVFLLIPFTDSFYQLAILVAFVGLSNGLSLGSLATSTFDVVPAHARGRLQALRRTLAEMGGVFTPLIGGYLANSFDAGVPFLVFAPFLVAAATLLALVGRETLAR
jgi:MFS family permease